MLNKNRCYSHCALIDDCAAQPSAGERVCRYAATFSSVLSRVSQQHTSKRNSDY